MSSCTNMGRCLRDWTKLLMTAVRVDTLEGVTQVLTELQVTILSSHSSDETVTTGAVVNWRHGTLGITALQLAVFQNNTGIVQILIAAGANVDSRDGLGRAAVHYAAYNGATQILKTLIDHGANVNVKFEELTLRRDPKPQFGNNIPLPDNWGRTPLHIATKLLHQECVALLIQSGADLGALDTTGLSPIQVIGINQNLDFCPKLVEKYEIILELFLTHDVDVCSSKNREIGKFLMFRSVEINSTKTLHMLIERGVRLCETDGQERSILHVAAKNDRLEVIKDIIDLCPEMIHTKDKNRFTSLHTAAKEGARECLKFLIEKGGNLSETAVDGTTVIDLIFENIPRPTSVFVELFHDNIQPNEYSVNDKNFAFDLDFGILAPTPKNQMSVIISLMNAANPSQICKVLTHPYLETFLRLKWSRVRIFYFFLIVIHFLFVMSLSCYVVILVPKEGKTKLALNHLQIASTVLMLTSFCLLVHVALEISLSPAYFTKQFETWLIIACSLLSIAIAVYGEYRSNPDCNPVEPCIPAWVQHVSAVSVWLGWIQFMLILGKFPTIGYFSLMFFTVLKNLLIVLTIFSCLIVGFALSFYVQFNGPSFDTIWRTFMKTIVMLMGEFDYVDIFPSDTKNNSSATPTRLSVPMLHPNPLGPTSYITFLIFVVVGSVVFVNLLIGLAVSDIQGIVQVGNFRRILKQAEFIANFEYIMSKRIKILHIPKSVRKLLHHRRHIPQKIKVAPGRKQNVVGENVTLPSEVLQALVKIALTKQRAEKLSRIRTRVGHVEHEDEEQQGEDVKQADVLVKISKDLKMITSYLDAADLESDMSLAARNTNLDFRISKRKRKNVSGYKQ